MKIRKNGSYMFILVLAMSILISWAAAAKTSEKWDATATARVNLRRNPGPNGVILSIVPQGHKVRIIEKKGLWCKVDVEGDIHGKGWVYAEYLEEFLPKDLEEEPASDLAEIIPKAPKTAAVSHTDSVENISGLPTQVNHAAVSPLKARTEDNRDHLLNTTPPQKAIVVDGMEQPSIRNEFHSWKDESMADSKRGVPRTAEPEPVAPSQRPPDVPAEDVNPKLPNVSLPPAISIADAKEPSSKRDEPRQPNHESDALSPGAPLQAAEPVVMPLAEPPYTSFKQDALAIGEESFSGAGQHENPALHQKRLPGGEKKNEGAVLATPFPVREKAVTDGHPVAAAKRKKPLFRPEFIRPVKRLLKALSILLSCLVILLLHRENKTTTKRYIEQTEHLPAMHGAFD